eukprot:2566655-Amphidinium_carterae.1
MMRATVVHSHVQDQCTPLHAKFRSESCPTTTELQTHAGRPLICRAEPTDLANTRLIASEAVQHSAALVTVCPRKTLLN